jgi:hypothetical protein
MPASTAGGILYLKKPSGCVNWKIGDLSCQDLKHQWISREWNIGAHSPIAHMMVPCRPALIGAMNDQRDRSISRGSRDRVVHPAPDDRQLPAAGIYPSQLDRSR